MRLGLLTLSVVGSIGLAIADINPSDHSTALTESISASYDELDGVVEPSSSVHIPNTGDDSLFISGLSFNADVKGKLMLYSMTVGHALTPSLTTEEKVTLRQEIARLEHCIRDSIWSKDAYESVINTLHGIHFDTEQRRGHYHDFLTSTDASVIDEHYCNKS